MRFVFKTSYNQDIQIFRDKVDFGWYAALALLAVEGDARGVEPARELALIPDAPGCPQVVECPVI